MSQGSIKQLNLAQIQNAAAAKKTAKDDTKAEPQTAVAVPNEPLVPPLDITPVDDPLEPQPSAFIDTSELSNLLDSLPSQPQDTLDTDLSSLLAPLAALEPAAEPTVQEDEPNQQQYDVNLLNLIKSGPSELIAAIETAKKFNIEPDTLAVSQQSLFDRSVIERALSTISDFNDVDEAKKQGISVAELRTLMTTYGELNLSAVKAKEQKLENNETESQLIKAEEDMTETVGDAKSDLLQMINQAGING